MKFTSRLHHHATPSSHTQGQDHYIFSQKNLAIPLDFEVPPWLVYLPSQLENKLILEHFVLLKSSINIQPKTQWDQKKAILPWKNVGKFSFYIYAACSSI